MHVEMNFQEAMNLHRDIVRRFEKIEGRSWGAEGAFIELSMQVGMLAKCVMQQENYYFYSTDAEKNKKQIGDELADIFCQIIRVCSHYCKSKEDMI